MMAEFQDCFDHSDGRWIACEECLHWYHKRCQKITDDMYDKWRKIEGEYICRQCRSTSGSFEYIKGLQRLKKASADGIAKVKIVAQREVLFHESIAYPVEPIAHGILRKLPVDNLAQSLINRYKLNCGQALISLGDGSCLFNSVSILISGTAERTRDRLRYLTCITMALQESEVKTVHHNIRDIFIVSEDYDQAVLNATNLRLFSSAWSIMALSLVIERPIQSFYPPVNGRQSEVWRILTTTFAATRYSSRKPVSIFWCSTRRPRPLVEWLPNHFVPLVTTVNNGDKLPIPTCLPEERTSTSVNEFYFSGYMPIADKMNPACVDKQRATTGERKPATSGERKPATSTKRKPATSGKRQRVESEGESGNPACVDKQRATTGERKPAKSGKRERATSGKRQRFKSEGESGSPEHRAEMLPRLSTSDDTHRFSTTSLRSASPTSILQSTFLAGGEDCPSSNHHFSSSLSSVDHENDPQSTSLNSREDCVLDTSEDLSSSNIDRDALHHAPSKGRFMSIDQLVDAVKTMSDHCVKQIPPGNKDNKFCLIDNSVNLEQWNARHRAAYVDDCGAYDSSVGTTVNRYFVLESNKAKSVYKKNGEYATESRKIVNKKTTQEWIPLNPQPNPEDVITGHFVYSKLRSDPSFKKRVTTFSGHSSTFCKPVAVVEYCGIHPGHNQPHGNRKHHGNPYCRTQHTVLSEAAKRAKNQPPMHVYMDMNKENSFDAPSNAKQIRNKKHNEKAANRENRPNGQNVADEVLETIAMLNTQNSVQQIIHCKGKIPSLIVYNKQQMEDLKANCVGENGSVIGFDRTFNVGPCFITPTTYKNKAVWHSESNEHPLMLGPTFLHWDGEFETYHTFISHLKRELQSEDIVVGSDAEKALTKALQLEFPSATHLLCTIHMKDNITRYLSEKVGCSMRDRTEIISFIFGEAGIAWADDSATSEFREDRLDDYFIKYPTFQRYYQKHIANKLKRHVQLPLQKGVIDTLWTNNNAESINHRIKQEIDWKPQKLLALIQCLDDISDAHFMDLRKSLYGRGNFVLCEEFRKHSVTPGEWAQKSANWKNKKMTNFLKMKKTAQAGNTLQSTDGRFAMPKSSGIAKKPGQRRRARAEKVKRQ